MLRLPDTARQVTPARRRPLSESEALVCRVGHLGCENCLCGPVACVVAWVELRGSETRMLSDSSCGTAEVSVQLCERCAGHFLEG